MLGCTQHCETNALCIRCEHRGGTRTGQQGKGRITGSCGLTQHCGFINLLSNRKTQLPKADLLTFWLSNFAISGHGPKRLILVPGPNWATEKWQNWHPIQEGILSSLGFCKTGARQCPLGRRLSSAARCGWTSCASWFVPVLVRFFPSYLANSRKTIQLVVSFEGLIPH